MVFRRRLGWARLSRRSQRNVLQTGSVPNTFGCGVAAGVRSKLAVDARAWCQRRNTSLAFVSVSALSWGIRRNVNAIPE